MTVLNDSVFSFPLPLSLWLQLDEAWVSTPVNQTTVLSEQKLREPIFWEVKVKLLSFDRLFMTPWTAGYQAPPSMGFSRQEYWSGVPFPSPGDLPNPGIEPRSPTLQADALPSEPTGKLT